MTESNIFNQYLNKRKCLVKKKEILQTAHVPDHLPHREDKVDEIVSIIAPSLNKTKPSNILIIGKTGTGKTVVMEYIGKELKKADPDEENCSYVFINCEIVDSPYAILSTIANSVISDPSRRVPFTGWSIDKIISELTTYMEEKKKIFIVTLDEIDRSFQKNGDDIFYYLTSINDELVDSSVSIIGITNNTKFTEFLSPRIRSRLCEVKIVFPPYSVDQLKDILDERAKDAFDEGVLEEGVIPYCAAITAQNGGDARRALNLLRMAADVAERNGDEKITEAHIRYAKNEMEKDAVNEVVKSLNSQLKLVLMSIIWNTEKGQSVMITGDVYTTYKNICEITGNSVVTQRRVADMISELDMLGLIHARVKSFGRAGRTKEIELSVSKEIISLLQSDEIFKDLENYRPPKQTTLM